MPPPPPRWTPRRVRRRPRRPLIREHWPACAAPSRHGLTSPRRHHPVILEPHGDLWSRPSRRARLLQVTALLCSCRRSSPARGQGVTLLRAAASGPPLCPAVEPPCKNRRCLPSPPAPAGPGRRSPARAAAVPRARSPLAPRAHSLPRRAARLRAQGRGRALARPPHAAARSSLPPRCRCPTPRRSPVPYCLTVPRRRGRDHRVPLPATPHAPHCRPQPRQPISKRPHALAAQDPAVTPDSG